MNSHLLGQGKTIVFCGVLSLNVLIIQELRNYGFKVISIHEELDKKYIFHYPNIRSFLYAKYRKIFCHDRETSKKAKYQFRRQKFFDILKDKKIDYALFLRADVLDDELLKEIKNQTTNGMINYQFDGLHRYPDIYSKINIFNRFFVFDYQDLHRYPNLLPTTNFYFEPHTELSNNGKIYFLAVHHDSRTHLINQFTAYAKNNHLSLDFNIAFAKKERQGDYKTPEVINFLNKVISFNDNIVRSQQSAILADFVINEHKGLSFRVFEAIGYQKKLITTNETVKLYDFYHPNNIFVYNGENHNELTEFLKLPYFPIDENIRQKYSFANWVRYVLDIPPYQKIELPEY